MIGVIADPAEHSAVCEFFELFKTPWEFYRKDRQYDVLLCAGEGQFEGTARLVLLYAGRKICFDDQQKIQTISRQRRTGTLSFRGARIPIYGDSITFQDVGKCLLTDRDSQECAAYLDDSGDVAVARVGYDLFAEISMLLTVGQPPANADVPALELHIALLRDLVTACGVSLVEIPPVPDGYQFVACLTHDVDHPAIRQHKWDHTMFGFLYRAIFDSLRKFVRRRMPFRDLLRNWAAALKLPFVHIGLAKDFWREFDDRYIELEKGLPSTFFVIPYKDRAGKTADGWAPALRAAGYGARDIAGAITKLIAAGCEVGLHGIDAWLDGSIGRQEMEEIRQLTGVSQIGVRMHWLYYDRHSPLTLESAGADYDSTIGYNGTVGYRAGTTQAFKPLGANRLLELPLHVMDTALFYPSHLGLSAGDAKTLVRPILDNAIQFGGILTINWHDRSVAPERLWGERYHDLIQELESRRAWFATAGQAISWFRKRRSAAFETVSIEPRALRVKVVVDQNNELPRLRLRIHKARKLGLIGTHGSEDYTEIAIDESVDIVDTAVPAEAQ